MWLKHLRIKGNLGCDFDTGFELADLVRIGLTNMDTFVYGRLE